MSPDSYQLFSTWFPAIVVGLLISLLAAVLWDILRRKTWCFASRFWPGILKEVGLDNSSLSRTEVEENQREVTEALSMLSSQITRNLVAGKSSMAETADSTEAESSNSNCSVSSNCGVTYDFDIEAQTGNIPLCTPARNPITFTGTAYFPDDTPIVVIRRTKKLFQRYAKGAVKRWKSSIILQASLPIEPCVLAEIGELAKNCMHVENRCTFQFGNWAILFYNAGEVHLHILKEGDVPVNVEARWQDESIMVRGLYLNGALVKVATKQTSITLRSTGPATQGSGGLDELHLPTQGLEVPREDSLIYSAKIVEADGISFIVRSEASFILPPRGKIALIDALWGQLHRISLSARKMIKFLLRAEATDYRPDLRFHLEHLELIVEHWKGVSEIELLDKRKEVLHYLQELQASGVVERAGPQFQEAHLYFIRDQRYLECWQKGLQDLNEVILRNTNDPQSGTHISIRGGIKFLLGDFENALQDFDLAYLNIGGHRSTVLLERALVKCMLARYAEAMQDVVAVITINPNLNDIQELQTCIQQILHQQASCRRVQYDRICQIPHLCEQDNSILKIPDLLTGDDWHADSNADDRCYFSIPLSAVLLNGAIMDLKPVGDRKSEGDELGEGRQTVVYEVLQPGGVRRDTEEWRRKVQILVNPPVFHLPRLRKSCFCQQNDENSYFPLDLRVWGSFFCDSSICRENLSEDGEFNQFREKEHPQAYLAQHKSCNSISLPLPISLPTAIDTMIEIAQAMASVHWGRDLPHRDLTNVVVSCKNTGSYQLEDFGLAETRSLDWESSAKPAAMIGTALYRAPEVFGLAGRSMARLKKCDVYIFGITCCEILTGALPFQDLRERDYGLGHTLPPDLNSDLKMVIEKCWHDDPQQRPNFTYILEELLRIKMNLDTVTDELQHDIAQLRFDRNQLPENLDLMENIRHNCMLSFVPSRNQLPSGHSQLSAASMQADVVSQGPSSFPQFSRSARSLMQPTSYSSLTPRSHLSDNLSYTESFKPNSPKQKVTGRSSSMSIFNPDTFFQQREDAAATEGKGVGNEVLNTDMLLPADASRTWRLPILTPRAAATGLVQTQQTPMSAAAAPNRVYYPPVQERTCGQYGPRSASTRLSVDSIEHSMLFMASSQHQNSHFNTSSSPRRGTSFDSPEINQLDSTMGKAGTPGFQEANKNRVDNQIHLTAEDIYSPFLETGNMNTLNQQDSDSDTMETNGNNSSYNGTHDVLWNELQQGQQTSPLQTQGPFKSWRYARILAPDLRKSDDRHNQYLLRRCLEMMKQIPHSNNIVQGIQNEGQAVDQRLPHSSSVPETVAYFGISHDPFDQGDKTGLIFQMPLPPGFRFYPKDEELVWHYSKEENSESFQIPVIDLAGKEQISEGGPKDLLQCSLPPKFNPWDFPRKSSESASKDNACESLGMPVSDLRTRSRKSPMQQIDLQPSIGYASFVAEATAPHTPLLVDKTKFIVEVPQARLEGDNSPLNIFEAKEVNDDTKKDRFHPSVTEIFDLSSSSLHVKGRVHRDFRSKGQSPRKARGEKSSKYYGVRFRPALHKWVAEISLEERKTVDKKVWLGTFDTEVTAARAVDAARKLLKCKRNFPLNLPCLKLDAYCEKIPVNLDLNHLGNDDIFNELTLFVKRKAKEYAASFCTSTPSNSNYVSVRTDHATVIVEPGFNSQPEEGEAKEWFFSPRAGKYPNRAATSGYWKATGMDKPIHMSQGALSEFEPGSSLFFNDCDQ